MNQILKTISILIGFFFLLGNLKAQEKELCVKYDFTDKSDFKDSRLELRAQGQKTLSTATYGVTVQAVRFDERNRPVKVGLPDYKESDFHVYKNHQTGELYCEDKFLVILKEELNLFQWETTRKTKKILGYKCQQAITNFRGREYTAWFTTELPFKAAPWKFHGLPGVVLQVKAKDGILKLKATQLNIREIQEEIVNPYEGMKALSWEKFCKIYISKTRKSQEEERIHAMEHGVRVPEFAKIRSRFEVIMEEANRRAEMDITERE